jgi:medium-chain acyl-[acyl-carrier-protein] hydrolase
MHRVDTRWFLSGNSELRAPARVICFPHGGGDPQAYADWQPTMGSGADILAVCVPGRGRRADERPPASIAELADRAAAAVGAAADRPTYLFGHSLGAVVAFEVARRLRDASTLLHLVASGSAAPALLPTDYLRWADQLDGPAFAEAMVRFEGMSAEIAGDSDLQEVLLPDLRADCRLIAQYRYQRAAPLAIGLSLVNGRADWHVDDDLLRPWQDEVTTAPEAHWRDGGHFYFADHPAAVVDVLRALVAPSDEHVEVI